jgi:hypothetical protein
MCDPSTTSEGWVVCSLHEEIVKAWHTELMLMQGMNATSCIGLKGVTTSSMVPASTHTRLFRRIFES